jgi:hypothetical protein
MGTKEYKSRRTVLAVLAHRCVSRRVAGKPELSWAEPWRRCMSLEDQIAAMAAVMIDNELAWRLQRLPPPNEHTPLERALIREAERRGIRAAKHVAG